MTSSQKKGFNSNTLVGDAQVKSLAEDNHIAGTSLAFSNLADASAVIDTEPDPTKIVEAEEEKEREREREREREKEDTKEPTPPEGANEAAVDTNPDTAASDNSTQPGFKTPRPVTDYLKDDDGLPGWAWTALGVGLIGSLDALDENWNSEDDDSPSQQTNQAPTFEQSSLELDAIDEDSSKTFTVEASDPDGDALSYNFSSPENGTLERGSADNEFIYTPNPNFHGEDSFTIAVRDGSGAIDTLPVSITVDPVEDEPTAEDLVVVATPPNQSIDIEIEAEDGDDDTLTYTLVNGSSTENGTVVVGSVDNRLIYTPKNGFSGRDSFEVSISDGKTTITQTVEVIVAPTLSLEAEYDDINEGDTGTTPLVITLNLDEAPTAEDLVLNVRQVGGEAELGSDYNLPSETITIPVGETSVQYVVDILGDTTDKRDETLLLEFFNPLLDQPLTVDTTIINDDPAASFSLRADDDSGLSDSDGITSVNSPTLVIETEAGADVSVYRDGELVGSATESEDNPGTYHFVAENLNDGQYEFATRVEVDDEALGDDIYLDLLIDTQSPFPQSTSVNTVNDTITLTFNEEVSLVDLSAIEFAVDGRATTATVDQERGTTFVFNIEADMKIVEDASYFIPEGIFVDVAGNALPDIEY